MEPPVAPRPGRPRAAASGRPRGRAAAAAALGLGLLAGCTSGDGAEGGADEGGGFFGGDEPQVELASLPAVSVLGGGGDTSVPASTAFYDASPVVVLVDDVADVTSAAARAEELGVPVLVVDAPAPEATPTDGASGPAPGPSAAGDDAGPAESPPGGAAEQGGAEELDPAEGLGGDGPGAGAGPPAAAGAATDAVAAEVERLGAEQVLAADPLSLAWAQEALDADVLDAATADVDAPARGDEPSDEETSGGGVVALGTGQPADLAAAATARAAGAQVQEVPGGDPRVDGAVVERLSTASPSSVVGLSSAFGDVDLLTSRMDVVATGYQLPGGGQVPFPGRHMVALYGSPGVPALGVMGEQPVDEAVERARQVAAGYEELAGDPVVPTFEIITTVASASAGPDGDYSTELDVELIRPWVEAAGENDMYVVLDLQPGRTDFLTQARRYEELLTEPHVGLALDPEWRLRPDQVHLRQVGQVGVDEVNAVGDWLAGLTAANDLPPKVFLLHQFQTRMITERELLDMSHDELVPLVHADGHGTPGQKLDTYRALQVDAPPGMRWGWKNFYDEDVPTMSPAETMAVDPVPDLVSYQ
ncbi:hypothetical protein [Pseudokineococcus sp. 1T1Z-3]|uniref:hypothetical protein n=1 Tax=Pseudokineococcus sp. 1T1Z-3 TaxID=3132745 RepID=UPI00309A6513